MTLNLKAEAVAAWIDGQPAAVEQDRIVLETPKKETCRIALRVEQEARALRRSRLRVPRGLHVHAGKDPPRRLVRARAGGLFGRGRLRQGG